MHNNFVINCCAIGAIQNSGRLPLFEKNCRSVRFRELYLCTPEIILAELKQQNGNW